ncbi:fatty acid desaturase family protein [Nostoc sp. CMAA1605]|uniref:fatty acid desaturase family protein n=1 Tax=Nostoc sp. CMAA1605 TaxID=2055159 RepID=UPI001F305A69|nr:acyl-CoA desaturase [Nostoc sp. CMAA1605]MCF4968510.1 acyl-CoA desaturase [Nostoc sp. CMAA1605]
MINNQQTTQQVIETSAKEPMKMLKFGKSSGFQMELTRRVNELIQTTGLRERDCPQMYIKAVILLLSFLIVYVSLVFLAKTWWVVLSLSILLGMVMAGIGFNIQHDGSHSAYSSYPWVNKLMAATLELIGFSSYYWLWGHTVLHHKYVNITGYDTDFDFGILTRKTPFQSWFAHHRWQHYYTWFLYGIDPIHWHFVSDFESFFTEKFYDRHYPRPKGVNLVIFLVGKGIFFTLAFGIPLIFHSLWTVLACYLITSFTLGIVLNVVFLYAHEVEEATFPMPFEDTGMIENDWAIHQIETTVNFPCNPVLTWFLGGLNYQIEHHLFPNICHVNYPAISKVVEETCQEFGVKYNKHQSIWAGLRSHFRWMRQMGMVHTM